MDGKRITDALASLVAASIVRDLRYFSDADLDEMLNLRQENENYLRTGTASTPNT